MKFRVFGVKRETGDRVSMVVEARDEVGAIEQAEADGIEVETVREDDALSSAGNTSPVHRSDRFVKTVSLILRVLAWISLFAGVINAIVVAMLKTGDGRVNFVRFSISLVSAGILWAVLMALAVIIELLSRIERNTRKSDDKSSL